METRLLYTEVASPSKRKKFAYSLNRDLAKIQSCCSTWGMKLNPCKTHSITISRYRTPYPPLTLCGLAMEVSSSLKFLGVTLDDNLTFENHNFNLASSIAQKTSLIRKCYKMMQYSNLSTHLFYLSLSTVLLFGVLKLIRI